MKNKSQVFADIRLVIVAVIWGSGFIATEYAFDAHMDTSLIMALRFSMAALILFFTSIKQLNTITKRELKNGFIAGCILFLGFYLQTKGQYLTTVSNSAFITATNVIMVPFIVWSITKKHPPVKSFILALVTLIGVGILTISPKEGFSSFNFGDLLVFGSAIAFASHIAYLGVAVQDSNPKFITLIQLTTAAILSSVVLVSFDINTLQSVEWKGGLAAVAYLGILCTCLCFFMQTSAQKYTTASKTGIILSLEGFFGTLFSVILALEPLTSKIVLGGIVILSAVILTEVNIKNKTNTKK